MFSAPMFWTYITASARNGTLYTGHTDNLINRVIQHRDHLIPGFTDKHGCTLLVWYEEHETREAAFKRERQIKKWYRAWKLQLIEGMNPEWRDLFDDLIYPDAPLHPDIAASMASVAQTSLGPRFRGDERE